ncbi:hypothetical protein GGTG_08418 [Gaeumannomyces tritici R3-111a-1]|uniref:Uncharacterized protein n=1 Tax=Gaeumannomyces tritici (strain R3-111a-1) TaxID=644352 RepID=J3P4I1_GAET3|nr:hypothetical protein GGTG_08418 [Gaeumannomyces tritici R3-111a-1]EJT74578.1 hypothetical protein GGTG_08418 [Gaeumannomyces tritici R3-111a-1]
MADSSCSSIPRTETEIWADITSEQEYSDANELAQVEVFRSALLSPGANSTKVARVVDGIQRYVFSQEGPHEYWLGFMWSQMLYVASWYPAEGSVHDIFLEALAIFKNGTPDTGNDKETLSEPCWPHLPGFGRSCGEDAYAVVDASPQGLWELDWHASVTSLIARVDSAGLYPLRMAAVWQMRVSLEEPLLACKYSRRHRLTAARTWIVHAAGRILDYLATVAAAGGDAERAEPSGLWDPDPIHGKGKTLWQNNDRLQKGTLCAGRDDIGTFSLERWEFWKARLEELRAEFGEIEGAEGWVDEMLDKMNEVQAAAGPFEKPRLDVDGEQTLVAANRQEKSAVVAGSSGKEPEKGSVVAARGEKSTDQESLLNDVVEKQLSVERNKKRGVLGRTKDKLELGCVVS